MPRWSMARAARAISASRKSPSALRSWRPKRWAGELLVNRFLTHIPHVGVRRAALRVLGAQFGPHVYLFAGSEFLSPERLRIAGGAHIGRSCQIDARGGITIGHHVVIASHVLLITADHDIQSPDFGGRLGEITIGDRVWIGSGAIVLKGVTLGEGAVVSAGSVVHSDVPPWTVVRGVPAVPIGTRSREQTYTIDHGPRWY